MESTKDVGKNVEVNECQKALDKLKTHCLSSPSLQNGEENGFGPDYDMHHDCYEDETQLLQELVDKVPYYKELEDRAIPKRPMNKVKNDDTFGNLYGECPICKMNVYGDSYEKKDNFCWNCGQAIDWSKDE